MRVETESLFKIGNTIEKILKFLKRGGFKKKPLASLTDYVGWFLKKFGGGGDKWDRLMWIVAFIAIILLAIFG